MSEHQYYEFQAIDRPSRDEVHARKPSFLERLRKAGL